MARTLAQVVRHLHRREGHEIVRLEIVLAHDPSNRLLAQVAFEVRVNRQFRSGRLWPCLVCPKSRATSSRPVGNRATRAVGRSAITTVPDDRFSAMLRASRRRPGGTVTGAARRNPADDLRSTPSPACPARSAPPTVAGRSSGCGLDGSRSTTAATACPQPVSRRRLAVSSGQPRWP